MWKFYSNAKGDQKKTANLMLYLEVILQQNWKKTTLIHLNTWISMARNVFLPLYKYIKAQNFSHLTKFSQPKNGKWSYWEASKIKMAKHPDSKDGYFFF